MPDGSIVAEGNRLFDVNTKPHHELRPHKNAKLILKVHKGDMLKLVEDGNEIVTRVFSMSPENKTLWLVRHTESGNIMKRYRDKDLKFIFLSFSKVKEKNVRKVHIDFLGRVKDSGPLSW